jgi:hypothetical protein
MDLSNAKAPPRYVPTLTDVVQDPAEGCVPAPEPAAPDVAAQAPAPRAAMPEPQPSARVVYSPSPASGSSARFPLAETVVPSLAEQEPEAGPELDAAAWAQVQMQAEERLVQRLLERVERVLDQRLRESISHVVQEQTRSVTLRLQEELESVVRQTVQEAIAQEREPEGGAPGFRSR